MMIIFNRVNIDGPFAITLETLIITNAQMSNNFATVRDRRNMSMNHDYETWVALSDSVNKTCVKCLIAEKSWWRHIRLAVKPRYLGNHASQIKSCNGTLSGTYARFFRIRHEKTHEAPPGGEITMTVYPICDKTSLSRKHCIAVKKLLWIVSPKVFYR